MNSKMLKLRVLDKQNMFETEKKKIIICGAEIDVQ